MSLAFLWSAKSSDRKFSALDLSPDLAAVILFSLLGLIVSVELIIHAPSDWFGWFCDAF